MIFDPVYLLVMVPGLVLSMWASFKVKSTFNHYSQVRPRSGLSGADAARALLRRNNVDGVQVEEVQGFLSDHYDPGARVLRLSPDVYHGRSLAALGVAAHQASHTPPNATQDAQTSLAPPPIAWAGYTFLRDDELEAYRGVNVAIRALACGLVFAPKARA